MQAPYQKKLVYAIYFSLPNMLKVAKKNLHQCLDYNFQLKKNSINYKLYHLLGNQHRCPLQKQLRLPFACNENN